MFKIDKDIPVPPINGRSGRPYKYPWRDLQVGDSFFVPNKSARQMSSNFSKWAKKYGFRLTARPVDGGVRVWRVE